MSVFYYGSVGHGDCFNYGSTYGCNCECPIFESGLCKLEDVEVFYKMVEENVDIDKEERKEIYKKYPKLLKYKLKNKL